MPKAQSRITSYGTTTFEDFRHTVRGDMELAGKLSSAYTKLFNLLGEMFPRMYTTSSHSSPQ